jgi:hypothetical protein
MNNFATLKLIGSFEKVVFYSIRLEGMDLSLYEEFFEKFNIKEYKDELSNMLSQIREIGKRGAYARYFRHEGSAEALPTSILGDGNGNLRLYCSRINENVVILYNGGIKTKQKAQDCPNVFLHFNLANKLSKKITQLMIDEEIKSDPKGRSGLIYDKSLTIEF